MACILCIDDSTYQLANTIPLLRAHGHQVMGAVHMVDVLAVVANNPIDAVVLNCIATKETSDIVQALRIIRPDVAIVMMSAFCQLPCDRLRHADACIQKGDTSATLLRTLDSILCARRYGLCRWVAV
jgi:response regulator RpfG family c-di-GMP phosphodiesterase